MGNRKKLEVHEHSYVSGPNANIAGRKLVHSHVGGDRGHTHAHTGPGAYTIDRDVWARLTGLRGGGRKKFTSAPSGPQLVAKSWSSTYTLIAMTPTGTDAVISAPPRQTRTRRSHGR